jgi:sugar phosphate isomerase/epimerase
MPFARRPFLQYAAGASLAAMSSNAWSIPGARPYLNTIGLQLYTLRNQMASAPVATLKHVKDAGYHQVELMEVMDADVLVPLAKELGLQVTSAFMSWATLGMASPKDTPSIKMVIDKAAKHGLKYLVFGYVGKGHRETADHYKGIADRSNLAGELCKGAGIQLCYHHHSFEFEKLPSGEAGFDVLVDRFDLELMKFEIDVFWAALGGRDPIKTLEQLEGRVAQVHLKDVLPGTAVIYDEGKVPKDAFKEVGSGALEMSKIIEVSRRIGVAQCHVEQDQSPDPLASVSQSIKHLHQPT